MTPVKTAAIGLSERVELYRHALGFNGLPADQLEEIADLTLVKCYSKGEIIFHQDFPCKFFHVVAEGLVKVSFCSPSGARMTYLLAERGEPLNLVGPFTGSPRFLSAEALENATVACVKRDDFISFAFKHPSVVINIMTILGHAIDSANSRIIDMMEKRVEQRLIRVLHTLQKKFGSTLRFTSTELAEIAGTTTESTLRAMSKLRAAGILTSRRGEIEIVDTDRLTCLSSETLWV